MDHEPAGVVDERVDECDEDREAEPDDDRSVAHEPGAASGSHRSVRRLTRNHQEYSRNWL
jgi:hypothetical protein